MGRGFLLWLLCLGILLATFWGAQHNAVLYLIAGVLLPLPLLVVGEQLGERPALWLGLAMAGFMVAVNPSWEGLSANLGFSSLLLMGLLLTSFQARGMSAPQAIINTMLVLAALALVVFLGQAYATGMEPQTMLAQKAKDILDTVKQVLGDQPDAGGLAPGISGGELAKLLTRLLPGLVVTNLGLVAWLNLVLARRMRVLMGGTEPQPPLYVWALPEWLIFGALGAGFFLLVPAPPVRMVSLNLLLVLAVLYFCQGVAVVAALLHRWRLPPALRLITYPLLFLQPFFFAIIILGVLDLWLDLRRLHRVDEA